METGRRAGRVGGDTVGAASAARAGQSCVRAFHAAPFFAPFHSLCAPPRSPPSATATPSLPPSTPRSWASAWTRSSATWPGCRLVSQGCRGGWAGGRVGGRGCACLTGGPQASRWRGLRPSSPGALCACLLAAAAWHSTPLPWPWPMHQHSQLPTPPTPPRHHSVSPLPCRPQGRRPGRPEVPSGL